MQRGGTVFSNTNLPLVFFVCFALLFVFFYLYIEYEYLFFSLKRGCEKRIEEFYYYFFLWFLGGGGITPRSDE